MFCSSLFLVLNKVKKNSEDKKWNCNVTGPNLQGHLQLGRPLGVPAGLVCGSLDLYRHGEDRRVDRTRLTQQAVLKARMDLVQTHQSVHGMVRVSHPPVQHYRNKDTDIKPKDQNCLSKL